MAVVEREWELAQLRSFLGSVGAPGGRSAAVLGVPGIGKSTLLDVVTGECAGWRILSARGTPLGTHVPHGVLIQLFSGLARIGAPGDEPFDGPGRMLRDLVLNCDIAADAAALSYSLHWVIARLAANQRVLVVVDDLHWADPASITILGNAMGLLRSERAGFLFGVRRIPREIANSVLSEILEVSTIVGPGPLTLAGTASIVAGSAPGGSGAELDVGRIHELSGGIPFFVTELVAMGLAGQELTSSLHVIESIGGRLDRLGDPHGEVARAVAVLGSDATPETICALAAVAGDALPRVVSDLISEGIFSDSGRLELAHPLISEAIRNGMDAGRLAALHDRAAGILHSLGGSGSRVAAHIVRSPIGHDEWRVALLLSAGHAALASGSVDDAIVYLGRALLEMRDGDPRRPGVLVDAARASRDANDPDAAVTQWREALTLVSDITVRTRILAELGATLFEAGDTRAADAAFERGISELTASGVATTQPIYREFAAKGLSVRLSISHHPSPFAQEVVEQAIGQRPKLDTSEDARLLGAAAVGLALSGASEAQASALALRAYRRWPRSGSGFPEDPATYLLAAVLNITSQFDECEELLTSAIEESRVSGRVLSEATARYCRGSLYFARGDIRHGVPDLLAAVNSVQLGWVRYRESAETMLIRCHIALGDTVAAARLALGDEYSSASDVLRSIQYIGKSDYWTRVGRPSKGLEFAYRARDAVPSGTDVFGFGWRASAGDALLALGDKAAALALATQEVALAESTGSYAAALGPALYRRARTLDDESEAIVLAERALELLGPSRPFAQLPVRQLLADLMIARGGVERAAEMLENALDYVQSQRLVRAEKRIRAVLGSIGHPIVPSSLERRVASLSPSEFRVASLAAQGLSNREIAGNLFVTLKTVEFHLSHCYRKLGIRARHDLARTLNQQVAVG
ncbi:MAG TPA: AAA family ATPase [Terrimesophilobacter sp.]|nr:AAA family ATPase [Terrimesophilobacter sp.]